MKITAIFGSPRKTGNSSTIANRFLDTARDLGAETRLFILNDMDFKGCQGCGACKSKVDHCVLEDDLAEVLQSIHQADVLVLASSVYFGDISGQLKSCFDRTYSFFNADFSCRLKRGKKSVFILAQGHPDENAFADIHSRYERWLSMFGFSQNHLIRAVGVREIGDVRNRKDVLQQAESIARSLVA
ncbi:MAG: flavodoxin family protein [Desulforhabdus sp.]|jgi:multimeric flavodoxin WrbA|nr:flavodoxin family protein [Desulforhabdus sp.]